MFSGVPAKGVTTTYTYDSAGNVLTESTPWAQGPPSTNRVVAYTRADTSHPDDITSITDPAGKVWSYEYDAHGNVIKATDPLGNVTIRCYDDLGRLKASITAEAVDAGVTCSSTAPAAGTSYFTYNDHGQLLAATDAMGDITTNTYDDDGNQLTSTDPKGNTTTFVYDAAGQLITEARADTTERDTEYWPDGRLKKQIDAAGKATTYNYDAQGRLTSTVDPLARTTTFVYDAAGNRTGIQDHGGSCTSTPKTSCTTFTYDTARQVTAVTYSDGTTPNVTGITYDANGQRTGMTDGAGTWTYAYDSLGRPTESTLVNKSKTTYGWDLRGNLTTIGYPSPTYPNTLGSVTRTYDDAGRWTAVTDWLSNTTSFGYDDDGNLTSQTKPNGTTVTYTHDDVGRATAIDHAPTSNLSSPFATFDYQRDDNGQVTAVATTGVPTDSRTWSYNTLNQLAGDTSATTSFGYDAGDNLTQLSTGTVQQFDDANQLCWSAPTGTGACGSPPTGATTYTYDTRGNRTSIVAPGGTTTLAYDQARRLKSHTANSVTTAYGYNADGLRTSKANGTSTDYAWNDAESLPTLLKDGAVAYLYGPGNQVLEQISGTTVHHAHTDQLGSIRAVTDSTGAVVATRTYDAYGKASGSTGTISMPFGYAGEYSDSESGFTYLRARYYDPNAGQFLTRDPIGAMTRDAYGYADNNPTNNTDPLGLACLGDWCTEDVIEELGDVMEEGSDWAYEHRDEIATGIAVVGGVACLAASAGACAVATHGGLILSGLDSIADDDAGDFGSDAVLQILSYGASRIASGDEILELVVTATHSVLDVYLNFEEVLAC